MLSGDLRGVDRLIAAINAEVRGGQLRRDLAKGIRAALEPAKREAQAAVRAIPSRASHPGPSLRGAVASRIKVESRLGKTTQRVSLRAKTVTVRGFTQAARRLNAAKGWRHPVYGNRQVWVRQVGRPGWWTAAIKTSRPAAHRAVEKALQDMADRIGRTGG